MGGMVKKTRMVSVMNGKTPPAARAPRFSSAGRAGGAIAQRLQSNLV